MKISDAGIKAIEQFEGVRYKAYDDGTGVMTIGVGHVKGVKEGDTATPEQVNQWLCEDVQEAETAVNRVHVPLTQYQYDALVSFVFNVGSGNFLSSTLLKKLELSQFDQAAEQFARWDQAGGRHIPGLLKRRLAEAAMFRGESFV